MTAATKQISCERCGRKFVCSPDDIGSCWCAAEPYRLPIPLPREAGTFKGCLCPSCLRAMTQFLQKAGGGPALR